MSTTDKKSTEGTKPVQSLASKMGIKENQIVQPTFRLGTGKVTKEPESIKKVRKSLHDILSDKGEAMRFNTWKKVKTKDGKTGYSGITKTLQQCITTENENGLVTVHHFQIFKTEYETDKANLEYITPEDIVTTQ